ncbi:MAG: hypothetical protein HYR72_24890 [Deltaproteobacteria bacterium]|nr:hypothetical protein [Deltaproteobacteria bacterium]
MDAKSLTRRAVLRLSSELVAADCDVENETELAHLFFWAILSEARGSGVSSNALRSEIRLTNGGRIDFGFRAVEAGVPYELFLELKVWVRPLHVSHMSKANVATRKRNECIRDAKRLSGLITNRACHHGGLLVLERNSSHLKRLLCDRLVEANCSLEEEWFPLTRSSAGNHQEHLGLIWVGPNTPLDLTAGMQRPPDGTASVARRSSTA